MSRIMNRSAPALNERGLADAMIRPAGFDFPSGSTTADNSARSCGVHVFTGLPGTSNTIVSTLSESVEVRTDGSMIHPCFSGVNRSGEGTSWLTGVQRPRPDQPVVVVLLDHVRAPTGHARA